MKKQFIGWAAATGLMALLFAQTAPASAQGDDGTRYIPNDHRPLQLQSGKQYHHTRKQAAGKMNHGHTTPSPQKAALICPVTGDKIAAVKDAVGQSTYKGKTYYFCCAGCKPRFDKDPARIVKNAAARKYEKM